MSHPQVQRMLDEWRRSRRLRLGALVVLGILGAQATLAMSDRLHAREEAFHDDAQLLGRLDEASREAGWPARAQAAETALAQARHSIPPARSDGLAQAEMQAWLTDLAVYAGVAGPAVRVETSLPVPGQPGTWQVLARLDGQATPAALPILARALTSALPWVRTERLEIGGGDTGRVSLVVRGYYRQGDALDAKAPPARPAELPAASSAPPAAELPRNPLARPSGIPSTKPARNPSAPPPGNPLAKPPGSASARPSDNPLMRPSASSFKPSPHAPRQPRERTEKGR
jgi:hypothetical protein